MSILEAAIAWADRGFRVFPVIPGAKEPATTNGVDDATDDHEQIERWFSNGRPYNLGVRLGSHILIDVDVRPEKDVDGRAFFAELCEREEIPEGAWQQTTPHEGMHVVAAIPNEMTLSAQSGELAPGLEWKTGNQYLIAAPSKFDGRLYREFGDGDPSVEIPVTLLFRIRQSIKRQPDRKKTTARHDQARAATLAIARKTVPVVQELEREGRTGEIERLVKGAVGIAERETDTPKSIIIVRNDLSGVVDEAETALLISDAQIYSRAELIVRLARTGKRVPGIRRPEGGPVIIPAEAAWIRDRVDRATDWIKNDSKGNPAPAIPPRWVGETIVVRRGESFPPLEGVVETPTLRPDGTVLETAGYDMATGLLYDPGSAEFPRVPERPDQRDAERAMVELQEPFLEFPFVSESDRSANIASILTMQARYAIDGPCPMFAVRSPTPGTGKGLVVDVVATIGTGRPAARMAPPRTDDEARKAILAMGLEGARVVMIDNVSRLFGSESIAAAITSTEWKDRLLGVNRMVTVPLRMVWMLTGNNVGFKGDLGRRVVPIDLDAEVEHPEDRTFQRPDLLEWVRQERGRLVTAALTVLRAYHVAGRPTHGKPKKGSFEAWDDLIRGLLVWVGAGDPLVGCERIREQGDVDRDALREALVAWMDCFPEAVSTTEAIERADKDRTLEAALAGVAGCPVKKLDAKRLGYALRRTANRPVDGLRFVVEGKTHGKNRWLVRGCDGCDG